MPINNGLAQFSNLMVIVAVVAYAVAMFLHACAFAFGKRRAIAAAPGKAELAPELVGAAVAAGGGAATAVGVPAGVIARANVTEADTMAVEAAARPAIPVPPGRQPLWPVGTWLRAAFALTCAGLVAQVLSVVTRGLSEHRIPWANMYEFLSAITAMGVLVLIVAAVWFRAYYMGLFVLVPVVLTLGIDVTVIYSPPGQVVPALQSYWIAIHVTAMIIATGMYLFGAVVTLTYLAADRSERLAAAGRQSAIAGILEHLPRSDSLDRLSYRAILFAFPAWTFAIIAGAMWANQAWGRAWGWDPKETWSFITWLVYAAFLHARATAGWRGRKAAFVHLVGFACLIFNLIGVNLWITGLHSYANM